MVGIAGMSLLAITGILCLHGAGRHCGRFTGLIAWGLTVCLLLVIIGFNYRRYVGQTNYPDEGALPTLNTSPLPNILLITLDTLRADQLGGYGNEVVQTPVIDALAAEGYLFEAAFAQVPGTTASHYSIITAAYPSQHGGVNGTAMKASLPTLAQILRIDGYNTTAFVSAQTVHSSNTGLHRGFDYYENSLSPYSTFFHHDTCQFLLAVHALSRLHHHSIPGDIVSDRAQAWLEKDEPKPFFFWIHYFDPHTYVTPKPFHAMYEGKSIRVRPR